MKKKVIIILFFFVGAISLLVLKNIYKTNSAGDSDAVQLEWKMNPEVITDLKTPVEFQFSLRDKKNFPIRDARILVEANMNHAGMVPVKTEAQSIDNGYRASLLLTMHGEWILFLTIISPDGSLTNKTLTFSTRPE